MVCTGRSSRTAPLRSDYDRPETIEETAELVTALGGTGIAVPVDHLDRRRCEALAERMRADHGHIDVLVNDIWGAEVLKGGPAEWDTPIWEHDLDTACASCGSRSTPTSSRRTTCCRCWSSEPGGLLVEVTDGTTEYNATSYRISVFYDLAKVAVNRLAFSQGHELAPHGGTAVAITPGWLRSEMMLEASAYRGATGATRRSGTTGAARLRAVGVAALRRPGRRRAGRRPGAGPVEPAVGRRRASWPQEYGFTDLDGSQPDVWRYIEEATEPGDEVDLTAYR